jgi:hypothetical protein
MVFSCGEADEAGFWVGPGKRGMIRPSDRTTKREVLGKRIEERRQSRRGERDSYRHFEKQWLACARTFPEEAAAIPRGANLGSDCRIQGVWSLFYVASTGSLNPLLG